MNYEKTELLLGLLSESEEEAKSVIQLKELILEKIRTSQDSKEKDSAWVKNFRKENDNSLYQSIIRIVKNLQAKHLVQPIKEKRNSKRYHRTIRLTDQAVVNQYMALQTQLSSDLLRTVLAEITEIKSQGPEAEKIAKLVLQKADTKIQRMVKAIRVVPDGIGRSPVAVDKLVINKIINAISDQKRIQIDFTEKYDHNKPAMDVSPISLVIKDGSYYLIAAPDDDDYENLYSYALQRIGGIKNIDIKSDYPSDGESRRRSDDMINRHFQYGHPVRVSDFPLQPFHKLTVEKRSAQLRLCQPEMIELRLRVAPRAEFHFIEKPLSKEQTLTLPSGFTGEQEDANPKSWSVLTVNLPYTILLLPFILSYGQWVRVEGPAEVMEQLKTVTQSMSKLY